MKKFTTQPQLTALQKETLRSWLTTTLGSEKLENSRSFPVSNKLVLYSDDKARVVEGSYWEMSDYGSTINLAGHSDVVSLSDRLAVLCALTQFCDDSAALRDATQKAIMRYLLGEYQSVAGSLVNAPVQPKGLAFSISGGVASLFEDGKWMKPSGEEVDVTGEDWVVCATELPKVEAPVFQVGDRVLFLQQYNYLGHDEVVTVTAIDVTRNRLSFNYDDNSNGYGLIEHFRPLPATEPEVFRVGDRVSWTEIPGVGPRIGVGSTITSNS